MKQRSPKRVNDALTVSVAQKLKELRAACGFSQEYVKENTGVNLQRSESGKTTVSLITLDILCRFYGTTLKDFFAELDLK
nr:helix-turn-helix transcriptional regulator [Alistipes sp. D31t1_170403_E11]